MVSPSESRILLPGEKGSGHFVIKAPERVDRLLGQPEVRLHIGGGQHFLEQYINIDADPESKADILLDMREINRLSLSNMVDEVFLNHSIGYLCLWEARDFFLTIRNFLRNSGYLVIETPDLEKAVKKLSSSKGNLAEHIEGVRGLNGFGLDHMEERFPFKPYAFCWSFWHMELELKRAGFAAVHKLPPQWHVPWRDMRVMAFREVGHDTNIVGIEKYPRSFVKIFRGMFSSFMK
jgi:hypothetical protein